MVKRSRKDPGRIFLFRPLRRYDLVCIVSWISQINRGSVAGREGLHEVFTRHYRNLWHSRWARTWVMTIHSRPAFCLTLTTAEGQPAPRLPGHSAFRSTPGPLDVQPLRPESGCANQLYLLYPPSVRANSRKLLLAWHAATVFIFLRCGLEQVQVAVPASETSESEALLMMGYRLVETTTEGPETTYLYLCKREEFTPVV